jgi:hypothetical protein
VVLAISHTLRVQETLSRPDALPCFLEVVHHLFENGGFVGHDRSIGVGILRSLDCFAFSRELPYQRREVAGGVLGHVLRILGAHYELNILSHYARRIDASLRSDAMSMRAKVLRRLGPPHYS